MRGDPVEPGQEPGTWREDIAGAVAIAEEIQHPEDWDPETHGDIPAGKGEPPAAYFRRQKGKGKGPEPDWVGFTVDGRYWEYHKGNGKGFGGPSFRQPWWRRWQLFERRVSRR